MSRTPVAAAYSIDPVNVPTIDVLAATPDDVRAILNRYGVAVISLPIKPEVMNIALERTKFYNTANAMLKAEYQVAEPTAFELTNPSKYKKRKAGDDTQGMIHQYGTPLHVLIQSNKVLRKTVSKLYGRNVNYLPNRLRISRRFKNDEKNLHIEAHELFRTDSEGNVELIPGETAMIVALMGTRRFGFWDMDGADLRPLKDYYESKGSKNFTGIASAYMHAHYPGRRRMINVDCSKTPHIIMWRETNPHEIAGSPSLSLFISPTGNFNHTLIKKVIRCQPIEYVGLTFHESNLLGLCYNMGGYEWPSGKKLYQFVHNRAWTHYKHKTRPYYIQRDGRFQQRLITTGNVDQHTNEYRSKLREKGIVLPARAFDKNMPNFVVDITEFPIQILTDYGFIPSAVRVVKRGVINIAGHLH